MNKKKLIPIVLMCLLVVGIASAALVSYLSNTITTNMVVESPIELVGDQFSFNIQYSGEDDFALIELTNNADTPITGDIEIAVSPDIGGIRIALSEDINYCLADMGDMTRVTTDCKTNYMEWLEDNIDWFDWEASHAYSDVLYPSPLVINHGGNSFDDIGYTGNKLILEDATIPAETTIYGVMYVSTNPALEPRFYTFDVTMVP